MNVAFLCLGGNIGNRTENINAGKKAIELLLGKIVSQSGIYETAAWGSDSKNNYLNQVIQVHTKLPVKKLLSGLLQIEKKLGRKRNSTKNSDRTLDIDILFFNSEVIEQKGLQVPHPRLHERNFVLKPLNDIAGGVTHPVLKKTVSTLLKNSKDTLAVKQHDPIKNLQYICIEGNIGSGKSTLAQALAKNLQTLYLPEEFEDNLLLPLFYENKKLFAFPLEYSFLLARFNQLQQVFKTEKKLIISDYSIYKCLWFAKVNLTPKNYSLFKKQFKIMLDQLPKPDLIIYLSTSTENLKQNIKKRGRKYEQGISDGYLNAVSAQFDKGITKLKNVKTLHLPLSAYHRGLETDSIRKINNFIKENFG
ncbi:MAG: 2-amino-4-hydroxy-6-hydroxymethyldihydropteridine diphosphokinase [Bacteroidetes bacterium]|nr:2-amino-4-hydroxy-6-hydroxymethyldihydropteridine diphosphokinase [Bacteroidota bacterium]